MEDFWDQCSKTRSFINNLISSLVWNCTMLIVVTRLDCFGSNTYTNWCYFKTNCVCCKLLKWWYAFFQIWLWYKCSFCIWSLSKYASCFVLVIQALLRPCQQNSDCQHISIWKRFHESTLEARSTGTGAFDNLKFSAFFSLSPTKLTCQTCLISLDIKTSHVYQRHLLIIYYCFRTVDLQHNCLPHLN